MNIYLDDVRGPLNISKPWVEHDWTIPPTVWTLVRTVPDCIALLAKHGEEVKVLSLDHDLGNTDRGHTGYDVLTWIEERVFNDSSFYVPEIRIHSMNHSEGGVKKMKAAVESNRRVKEGAK